jgi:hypothetical protein
MKLRPFIPLLAVLAVVVQPAAAGRLVFLNGDRLSGELLGTDGPAHLSWKIAGQAQPLRIPLASVHKWLADTPDNETAASGHDLALSLTNGDTLYGRLLGLDDQVINLESTAFGRIGVPRQMIAGITVTEGDYFLLAHPGRGRDWWKPKGQTAWRGENGRMIASRHGTIGRATLPPGQPAPERIRIDFDYTNDEQGAGLGIHFFCSNPKNPADETNYTIQISGSYAHARRVFSEEQVRGIFGPRNNRRIEPLGDGVAFKRRLGGSSARVTILGDARAGRLILRIDDQTVGEWNDPRGLQGKHGSGIGFTNHSQGTTIVANLTVARWDGADERGEDTEAPAKDTVFLRNDDLFEGEVSGLENRLLRIKADEFGEVAIPTERILRIRLGRDGIEQARRMPGDVALAFQGGGRLTLQLRDLQDGTLTGYTQNSGETKVALEALREIEFNLYNEKFPSPDRALDRGIESLIDSDW